MFDAYRRSMGARSHSLNKNLDSTSKYKENQSSNGRGSWIRTNDLQYPKLPRYQAALYPDELETMSIHA
jgi:hypothetical protein